MKDLNGIIDDLKSKHYKILFVTKYGSHLYGTNTENSDLDIKGVFVPSLEDVILKRDIESVSYSTNNQSKNSKFDVDIQLYSVYKLVNDLVKGDINSIDLLFAYTNTNCTLFVDDNWLQICVPALKSLLNGQLLGLKSYILKQARTYGIKGSRLFELRKLRDWLINKHGTVKDILYNINFSEYQFVKPWVEDDSHIGIVIMDKKFPFHRSIDFLIERINHMIDSYGKRTKKVMENGGIDYKALSHAYRAVVQMGCLLENGEITFPLTGKSLEIIMNIKLGKYTLEKCLLLIEQKLDEIEETQNAIFNNNISDSYKHHVLKTILSNIWKIPSIQTSNE